MVGVPPALFLLTRGFIPLSSYGLKAQIKIAQGRAKRHLGLDGQKRFCGLKAQLKLPFQGEEVFLFRLPKVSLRSALG